MCITISILMFCCIDYILLESQDTQNLVLQITFNKSFFSYVSEYSILYAKIEEITFLIYVFCN